MLATQVLASSFHSSSLLARQKDIVCILMAANLNNITVALTDGTAFSSKSFVDERTGIISSFVRDDQGDGLNSSVILELQLLNGRPSMIICWFRLATLPLRRTIHMDSRMTMSASDYDTTDGSEPPLRTLDCPQRTALRSNRLIK